MANHCSYCDTRRPTPTPEYPDGTKLMIVQGEWYEFCESCGNDPQYSFISSVTGEKATMAEVLADLESAVNVSLEGES
tara:strand:+ start:1194 stop:1427 length:234 start_codon:yes stop_codon:yes gene_type:complete